MKPWHRPAVHLLLLCLAAAWIHGSCPGPSFASQPHPPTTYHPPPPRSPLARALRGASPPGQQVRTAATEAPSAWLRAAVAAVAVLVAAVGMVPGAARADGGSVSLYFGQGCFWHVQNELVNQEMKVLGRQGADITALVGYAGGTDVGGNGEVCYHNPQNAPDYGVMGHTEVVNVVVPEDKVGEIGNVLLDYAARSTFGRHDPQDRGSEYRSAIGLPGGMDGPAFKQIEQVSNGRLQFVKGQGNDGDTLLSKKVWVYDTAKFPFYQGEIYHQFHDDMLDKYPDSYHQLRKEGLKAGNIKRVACPDMKVQS